MRKLLLVFAILVFFAGCSTTVDTSEPAQSASAIEFEKPPPPPKLSVTETQLSPVSTPDSAIRKLVENAKEELAQRLSVPTDQIHVVEAKAVNWPDTSLGCPQPDMAYDTVITPGYWILLEANNQQYPYHTDQKDQIILCLPDTVNTESENPLLPIIPINPTEIKDGQPWVPVD